MNLTSHIARVVHIIESLPSTAFHVVVIIVLVGMIRSLVEILDATTLITLPWEPMKTLHLIAFYTCAYFLFTLVFKILLPKEERRHAPTIALGAVFLGLLPPLIDLIVPHTLGRYNYFLTFSWSLSTPLLRIGQVLMMWLAISGAGLYIWYKTRSLLRGVTAAIVAYLVIQFIGWGILKMGTLLYTIIAPELGLSIDYFLRTQQTTSFKEMLALHTCMTLVLTGCALIAFAIVRLPAFIPVLKRLPLALPWGALVILGAALQGSGIDTYVAIKAVFMILLFMFIQAENDFYDKKLDSLERGASVITKDDIFLLRFFLTIIVTTFLLFDPAFSMILILAYMLGVLYNHEKFRLKRHFLTGTSIVVVGSFLAMLAGFFYFSVIRTTGMMAIMSCFAVLFGLLANMRDYKDVVSDRAGGVKTLYVWCEKRGLSSERLHRGLYIPVMVWAGAIIAYLVTHSEGSKMAILLMILIGGGAFLPLYFLRRPLASVMSTYLFATFLLLVTALFIVPLLHNTL